MLAGRQCFHILGVYYIIILSVVQYKTSFTLIQRLEVSTSPLLFSCSHSIFRFTLNSLKEVVYNECVGLEGIAHPPLYASLGPINKSPNFSAPLAFH